MSEKIMYTQEITLSFWGFLKHQRFGIMVAAGAWPFMFILGRLSCK